MDRRHLSRRCAVRAVIQDEENGDTASAFVDDFAFKRAEGTSELMSGQMVSRSRSFDVEFGWASCLSCGMRDCCIFSLRIVVFVLLCGCQVPRGTAPWEEPRSRPQISLPAQDLDLHPPRIASRRSIEEIGLEGVNPEEFTSSVEQGVQALLALQYADGSWPGPEPVETTARSLYVLLAGPEIGRREEAVQDAVDWLQQQVSPSGRIQDRDLENIAAVHALMVEALCAARSRQTSGVDVGQLTAMVDVLLRSQGADGLWRDDFAPSGRANMLAGSEIALALLASCAAEIRPTACEQALFRYTQAAISFQDPDTGRFGAYMRGVGSPSLTGLGVELLCRLGYVDQPAALRAQWALANLGTGWSRRLADRPLASASLLAQGAAASGPRLLQAVWMPLQEEIRAYQREDGSWVGPFQEEKLGPAYGTAAALRILMAPLRGHGAERTHPFVKPLQRGEHRLLLIGVLPVDTDHAFLYDSEHPVWEIAFGILLHEEDPDRVVSLLARDLREQRLPEVKSSPARSQALRQLPGVLRTSKVARRLPTWALIGEWLYQTLETQGRTLKQGLRRYWQNHLRAVRRSPLLSAETVYSVLQHLPEALQDAALEEVLMDRESLGSDWERVLSAWRSGNRPETILRWNLLKSNHPHLGRLLLAFESRVLPEMLSALHEKAQGESSTAVVIPAVWYPEVLTSLEDEGWEE